MYSLGLGVAQNEETTFKWYLDAANKGGNLAQYIVVLCYGNGHDVQWYLIRAKQRTEVDYNDPEEVFLFITAK
jgi:TPR repeat protein